MFLWKIELKRAKLTVTGIKSDNLINYLKKR